MPFEDSVNFLSGTSAGMAQVLVGHPFDTIKVRLQTQGQERLYSGAWDCLKRTLRDEKIYGLYKGVTSPILGIGICNAVLFTANGLFLNLLTPTGGSPPTLSTVWMAGSLAGGVMAFVNCPIELLKIRLQIQRSSRERLYSSIFDCAWKTVRSEGPRGIYRGISATLIRDVSSFAGYFGVYEAVKMFFHLQNQDYPLKSWQYLASGGLAGLAAWHPVCYVSDVVKSQMQSSSRLISSSTSDTIRSIWRLSGWRGFFRGYTPTMLRAFPANAATFFAYETTKSFLTNRL